MFAVRRGDEAEPPPPGWAELGRNPLYSLKVVPKISDADRLCRALGVAAHDEYNARQIAACVSPATHEMIVTENAPPTTIKHENLHTWGPVHHDGQRWFWPDGRPVGPLGPDQARMLLAMARSGAQTAQATGPVETATTAPVPRGLLALGQTAAPR